MFERLDSQELGLFFAISHGVITLALSRLHTKAHDARSYFVKRLSYLAIEPSSGAFLFALRASRMTRDEKFAMVPPSQGGSLPFLLTTLLGLIPEAFVKRLRISRPLLPEFLDRLELRRLRVGGAVVDLAFRRDAQDVHVDVVKLQGELDVQVDNKGHERN